ncbi:unnamed protein product, partial [Ceratitis capitata]
MIQTTMTLSATEGSSSNHMAETTQRQHGFHGFHVSVMSVSISADMVGHICMVLRRTLAQSQ